MNAVSSEVATAGQVANPFASSPIAAAPSGAAAQALVQREVSEVQAAMVIAQRFPRDPIVSMDRILNACGRPGLAQSALYEYARGGSTITGPSIRLAEELARQWGNIVTGVTELSRGNGISECLAYAWDLQTNFRDEKRFQVRHWRDTRQGGHALKEERDIYELIANMGARRKRACLLAVIPGDVQEAAVKQCELTLTNEIDVTPERIAEMVGAFGDYGVTKAMIEKRIQRRIESITSGNVLQMRKIFNSLKDGMSKAADWFETDAEQATGEAQAPTTGVGAAKAALQSRQATKLPQYDEKTALAAIKACKSLDKLAAVRAEVFADFTETGRPIPISVEAAANDRRASLEE